MGSASQSVGCLWAVPVSQMAVCGQCQSVSWLFVGSASQSVGCLWAVPVSQLAVVLASAAVSAGLTALLQHLTQLLWPDTTAFSLSNFIHLCFLPPAIKPSLIEMWTRNTERAKCQWS